jgi:hypothetical protein
VYELSLEGLVRLASHLRAREASRIFSESRHYAMCPSKEVLLARLGEIRPPTRAGGKIWFRSRGTIEGVLIAMLVGQPIPPIEVKSIKGCGCWKYAVKDGFHRYYASVALSFGYIPIAVNDWEFETPSEP